MGATLDSHIRLLTIDDLEGALTLSTTAGWNQRTEDWRMLLRIAPGGGFCALSQGRIVGTAIGIDFGGFGWIAMMLVAPAYRGQGLGGRLLEAAMGALPRDRPIRLDATPLGRPLYQRYGFEDETTLSRQVAEASGRGPAADTAFAVRPLTAADFPRVTEHDTHVFGGNRHVVLRWALDHAPQYAHVAEADAGFPQYCFGRTGRLFDQIGPVVAGHADIATALVGAAVQAAGNRPVVVDAFDDRTAFAGWLRGAGFEGQRPLYRMRRPGRRAPASDAVNRPALFEFAILGPEFG
jgi:GNAT superfamily N-acetyltransferase